MKKIITAASILLLLSGCGGGGGDDSTAANASSATAANSTATNDSGTTTDNSTATNDNGTTTGNSTGTNDGSDAGNSTRVTSSSEIVASAEFNFAASRTVDIDFDVPEARNAEGMLSLCNEYTKTGDSYDINYDSCTVQASMLNGVYNGKMELTNNVNSIVGVVWFTDPSIAPVYKEFAIANTAERAFRSRGGKINHIISWK